MKNVFIQNKIERLTKGKEENGKRYHLLSSNNEHVSTHVLTCSIHESHVGVVISLTRILMNVETCQREKEFEKDFRSKF